MTTNTIEQALEFLAQQPQSDIRWGKPVTFSTAGHILALLFIPFLWELHADEPLKPVRVLEINVMGSRDWALKGTGHDFGRGPLPDKSLLATPNGMKGPVAHGNTLKNSKSLTIRKPSAAAQPHPLIPSGPIFASAHSGGVDPGVGREKIYVARSSMRMSVKSHGPHDSGEGLVGPPGGPVTLTTRRGGGGNGNGKGQFLMGGDGSVDGGDILERRGEPIVQDYHGVSQDIVGMKAESPEMPQLPDDAFFSIGGPLSHRKILKLKLPKYPRWAEESGVEGQIAVRLYVRPNGKVKSNLIVEHTSGYPELDKLVMETVKDMLFAPLPDDQFLREEWGVATFNFRLHKTQSTGG